jgi:DNA-binding NarL/FixJ family response regulator
LSPEAADALVGASAAPAQFGEELTDKEREVLVLVAKGFSNNQIAERLHRSPFTVRHHVSQVISKLGAVNRAEAAALAVQRGLLD